MERWNSLTDEQRRQVVLGAGVVLVLALLAAFLYARRTMITERLHEEVDEIVRERQRVRVEMDGDDDGDEGEGAA